jgi:hypothetical protein
VKVADSRVWLRRKRTACGIPAFGCVLLGLVSCGQVLGLRDDYYVIGGEGAASGKPEGVGAGAGVGGASAGGTATGGASGGAAEVSDAGATNAGAPDRARCADHPLSAESEWILTASPDYRTNPPSALTDHSVARWSTGKPQTGTEWLQIDFGQTVNLRRINLQQGTANSNDYPRQYAVLVSDTADNLRGTACKSGFGMSGVSTTIVLPEVTSGRYLLIKQTDSSLSWWSAEEIEVSCFDD